MKIIKISNGVKVTKKISYKLTIYFVAISVVFSSFAPTMSLAQEAEHTSSSETTVQEPQVVDLPSPDTILETDLSVVEEPQVIAEEPPVDLGELIPDQVLAEASAEDDGVPVDMYANRDNSGLQPSDQTGKYNVDEFTGVFSYSYPLDIPKGRNDLQANIALQYNHRNQNLGSMTGFGWEFNIPNVVRENRTGIDKLYAENYFILNGARLEAISVDSNGYGTYGKLVEDDFSKIEFNNSNKWLVTDKLGTVYTYGSSSLARQDNPSNTSQVYKWMLEEVRDTNDNFIKYEYYKDSGQIYPKKITYTGHGTTDGIFTVNFEPFASGTPTEDNLLSVSYETGFEVRTKYLIDKVDIKINGVLATSYDLDFTLNDNSNKYLLSSIIPKYYEDGGYYIKDKVEFDYSNNQVSYDIDPSYDLPSGQYLGEVPWTFDNRRNMFVDLNGDGFTDYVRIDCAYNSGSGDISVTAWENDGQGGWTGSNYSQSIGNGFLCGNLYGVYYSIPVAFAELNGDNLIDMVTDTTYYMNTGSGWQSESGGLPVSLFDQVGPGLTPMNQVVFNDMNKDGYDDIVYNYQPDNDTSKIDVYMRDINTGVWVLDTNYSLTLDLPFSDCLMVGGDPFGFVDVNNDHLLDIFYAYNCTFFGPEYVDSKVYLNSGTNLHQTSDYDVPLTPSNWSENKSADYTSDLNQDGIVDFGAYGRDKWNDSNGEHSLGGLNLMGQTIFSYTYAWGYDYYMAVSPVGIVDLNNDQIQDVIHSFNDGVVQDQFNDIYISHGDKPDILEKIDYQSGTNIEIYYDYSNREKDNLNNPLNSDLPFNLHVVKEVAVNDGLDSWQGLQYEYSDGKTQTYASQNIKDVYGFSKVSKKIGKAMSNVDIGDGSDGSFVSSGNEIWTIDKNFTSLNIQAGHTITVEPDVTIKVQGQAIINGILTAEGQGYSGGGSSNLYGQWGGGPGAGAGGTYVNLERTLGGGGAGYFANGQNAQGSTSYGVGGLSYGSEDLEPILKGSGGGGSGSSYPANGAHGGAGGGIVQIFAGSLIVNGEINADGIDGQDGDGNAGHYTGGAGGGSGGSIYIRVLDTANIGNGSIHANGGAKGLGGYSNDGGNGSDGRVRIEAKNIIGSTSPVYYSENNFSYSIDNVLNDQGLQKNINYYQTAKDDDIYLHGKLEKSEKLDYQDTVLGKKFTTWQESNLGNNRKFAYTSEEISAEVYIESSDNYWPEMSNDANTIALWQMNGLEATGNKMLDEKGNNDLVEVANPSSSFGRNLELYNGSYKLDGVDDYLYTDGQDFNFESNENFTIEAWVRTEGEAYIVSKSISSENIRYELLINASGRAEFYYYDSNNYSATGITDIRDGLWHYVAGVLNGNTMYVYVDGILEGSIGVLPGRYFTNSGPLKLATDKNVVTFSKIYLDEVRISNIARSSSEISSYYNSGIPNPIYDYKNSVATTYDYDLTNGNLLTEHNLGEVTVNTDTGAISNTLPGDEKETDYDYAVNSTKHILSAPKTKIISDSVNTKQQDIYYNNQAYGQVDKVNPTKEDYISDDVEVNRSFNSYGLVYEQSDPKFATTTISYDIYNMYPDTSTDPLNNVTYTDYNLLNGQVESMTDPNGKITENTFDAFGRLIEVRQSDKDNPNTLVLKQEVSYQDSTLPRYKETKNYFDTSIYTTSREYYDGLGRTIQTKTQTGNAGEYSTVDINYDSQGRVSRQSLPYITTSISYSSPNLSKPAKTYTYDGLDRVLSEATPTGVTSYEYDGFKTIITDANANIKELSKDAYGNLVEVKEHESTNTYTSTYDYTLTNKLEKITDSQSNLRNFHYDTLDNLDLQDMVHIPSATSTPTISYTHDKNGNVLTENSFKGDNISYVYDDLNRVLFEKLDGVDQITYTYDQNGDIGQLSSVVYADGNSRQYDYDVLGNLRTSTTTIEGEDFVMHFDYNLNGDIKSITYPNDFVVSYGFNSAGQVDTVYLDKGQGNTTLVENITYNQNGQMIHLERSNGVDTDYTYNPNENFRLTDLDTTLLTTKLQDIHYDYDNVGNITQITDNADIDLAKTVSYGYDDLYRLTSSSVNYASSTISDYSVNYDYDSIGNMTFNSELGLLGDLDYNNDNPHQVSSHLFTDFTYDDAGNLLDNGNITLYWDHRNRVDKTYNTSTEDYTYYEYDHNNQRMLKYTEAYVYVNPNPDPEPIGEPITMLAPSEGLIKLATEQGPYWTWKRIKEDKYVDGYFEQNKSNQNKTHIFLNNTKIATVNHEDDPYFILSDHLGSSSILVDNTGAISEVTDYLPYGKINYEDTTTYSGNDYTFTGQEYDEENNTQYFGVRYYDNDVGRFTSIDPVIIRVDSLEKILVNPQNLNGYAYAGNNPVIFVDPDGNFSIRFDQLPVFKHYARWVDNNTAQSSNLSVSMTPIVGDVQDAYEAISGNETFTGEQLSGGERTVSGIAAVVPFVGGAVIREGAQQITKHTDEIKTLYHGSVDNFRDIMKEGFSNFKNLHLTENIEDAVRYSQKRTNALDPGVVPVEVPRKFFDDFIKPFKDDRYTDFEYKIPDSKVVDKINDFLNKK